MSAKYEKLIDLIVNEEQDKARALFHEIVVEQSRKIYENLVSEEEMHEGESSDFVDSLGNDEDHIEGDEEGIETGDGDEFGGEEGEFDAEEGEGSVEDRVQDLESAIDELKAEFDQLMAGEEHEEEEFPGIHGDDAADGDEFGSEEGSEFDQDEDNGDMEESMVREYVEKVASQGNAEGQAVGSGGKSTNVNKKSNWAGKNDHGGKNIKFDQGGANEVPTGPKAPSNEYTKGEGKLIGKVENSPGARAGQTFSQGPKAKTSQATGVNTKSPLAK